MRATIGGFVLLASVLGLAPALASECPGNPDALGTSRTLVIDSKEHSLLGGFQYSESLPLNDKEVVITFDDGPLPAYSNRILDILASECVKATYFMVGKMARAYPHVVRRTHDEGHTIANHSLSHPFTFHRMSVEQAAREIEGGFDSLRAVLGETGTVAPFFRVPGLLRQSSVENYLRSRGVSTWSVDFMADDWRRISAQEVVRRAIDRIEAKGRGILLLHDIQPATALGLPRLLAELKSRGYRIVHVVPATADRPKTPTIPEQWAVRRPPPGIWPRVLPAALPAPEPTLAAPGLRNFGFEQRRADVLSAADKVRFGDRELSLLQETEWPRVVKVAALPQGLLSPAETLPAPALENFRYSRVWRAKTTTRAARVRAIKRAVVSTASPKNGSIKNGSPKTGAHSNGAAPTPRAADAKNGGRPVTRPRPIGHQIQLPKPAAAVPALSKVGMR